MSSKSVYAIVESQQQAESIVTQLKNDGFSNDRISVLFPDKSTSQDFAHEKHTKAPEGAVTGGVTGGAIGGALGWIAGIGALAIPGVGPFIAAGPLAAAIGGVAVGASIGGIAGGLIGMGIPELEAKRYEGKIKEGNILISVHTESSDEISGAKEILEDNGGEDICTASMAKNDDDDSEDETEGHPVRPQSEGSERYSRSMRPGQTTSTLPTPAAGRSGSNTGASATSTPIV